MNEPLETNEKKPSENDEGSKAVAFTPPTPKIPGKNKGGRPKGSTKVRHGRKVEKMAVFEPEIVPEAQPSEAPLGVEPEIVEVPVQVTPKMDSVSAEVLAGISSSMIVGAVGFVIPSFSIEEDKFLELKKAQASYFQTFDEFNITPGTKCLIESGKVICEKIFSEPTYLEELKTSLKKYFSWIKSKVS